MVTKLCNGWEQGCNDQVQIAGRFVIRMVVVVSEQEITRTYGDQKDGRGLAKIIIRIRRWLRELQRILGGEKVLLTPEGEMVGELIEMRSLEGIVNSKGIRKGLVAIQEQKVRSTRGETLILRTISKKIGSVSNPIRNGRK